VGFFSESLLFIVADAQLVTAFAYGINFGKSGKCTVSSYHYSVMVNTLVIALACLTLSVYLPRHYWRTRLPSFLRTLATLVVFIFLLRFLAYQVDQESSPELMLVYRSDRTDSSLFLPVACFLDPDLDPFKRLSPAQSNGIGGTGTKWTPGLTLAFLVAACYFVAHVTRLLCHVKKSKPRPSVWLSVFIILSCVVAIGLCFGHTLVLRRWIDMSGWMEQPDGPGTNPGNPEKDLVGIGQLLPLTTMIWILILSFDLGKRSRSVPDDIATDSKIQSRGDPEPEKRHRWVGHR
jgi:uncharacterized membrane protein YoaK (UPF0700 family)